jgi:hypothetical protein
VLEDGHGMPCPYSDVAAWLEPGFGTQTKCHRTILVSNPELMHPTKRTNRISQVEAELIRIR